VFSAPAPALAALVIGAFALMKLLQRFFDDHMTKGNTIQLLIRQAALTIAALPQQNWVLSPISATGKAKGTVTVSHF
jgi:hypothetical protein